MSCDAVPVDVKAANDAVTVRDSGGAAIVRDWGETAGTDDAAPVNGNGAPVNEIDGDLLAVSDAYRDDRPCNVVLGGRRSAPRVPSAVLSAPRCRSDDAHSRARSCQQIHDFGDHLCRLYRDQARSRIFWRF